MLYIVTVDLDNAAFCAEKSFLRVVVVVVGGTVTDIDKLAGSVSNLQAGFESHRYICSSQIATAVYLAYQLRKPVLVEGPAGVGKT